MFEELRAQYTRYDNYKNDVSLTTKILLVLDEKVIFLVSSSHSVLRPGFFERYGMVNEVNHGGLSIRELRGFSGFSGHFLHVLCKKILAKFVFPLGHSDPKSFTQFV